MAINQPLPKVKAGDPIRASDIMALRDQLQRQKLIPAGSGIVIQETEQGTLVRSGRQPDFWFGKANGNITARSGTTLGTGKVTIYYDSVSGTTHTATSSGQDIDVINCSGNTMGSGEGITNGKFCFAQRDAYGNILVGPAEC